MKKDKVTKDETQENLVMTIKIYEDTTKGMGVRIISENSKMGYRNLLNIKDTVKRSFNKILKEW